MFRISVDRTPTGIGTTIIVTLEEDKVIIIVDQVKEVVDTYNTILKILDQEETEEEEILVKTNNKEETIEVTIEETEEGIHIEGE